MDSPDNELRRGFGLSTTTYVVIASMVGTGILTTSGYILKDTGSPTLMLGLWLLGGGLALCGALTVAELAGAMPEAGGEYVYIREAYGHLPAFLYGWVTFVIGFSAPTALTAHAAGRYLIEVYPPADPAAAELVIRGLAVVMIVGFTIVHLRGQSISARVQSATTLIKLVVLFALIVGAFVVGRGSALRFQPDLPTEAWPWGTLGTSLVYVMFSYTGWNAATYLAGEVRDPNRLLPWSLVLGCCGVIVLYLLLNLVYIYALPADEIRQMPYDRVEAIAALAAQRLFGPWVARPLSVAIGVGLLATVSAFVLTGPRVYYAMARDGLFFAAVGRLHPRTGTPNAAIIAQAVCTLVLLVSGSFKNILTFAGVGLSISSFFVILSVYVLRWRKPDLPRPFRTPGYPIVPLVFLVCTGWMIIFAFLNDPRWPSVSLGVILLGIPLYYVWRAISPGRPAAGFPVITDESTTDSD